MVSLENALNVDIRYIKKKTALNVDMQPKKNWKKDFAFCLFPHAQLYSPWYGLPKKPKIVLW